MPTQVIRESHLSGKDIEHPGGPALQRCELGASEGYAFESFGSGNGSGSSRAKRRRRSGWGAVSLGSRVLASYRLQMHDPIAQVNIQGDFLGFASGRDAPLAMTTRILMVDAAVEVFMANYRWPQNSTTVIPDPDYWHEFASLISGSPSYKQCCFREILSLTQNDKSDSEL